MDYKSLNEGQRQKINQIINNKIQMEWNDPFFMDTLMGKLPSVRRFQDEEDIKDDVNKLINLMKSYNSFLSNKEKFIYDIKNIVNDIKKKKPYWYGLNVNELENCICQQKICLISGEGGIGKSYFIKCYEEKLEQEGIPHVCLYGKFVKDVQEIDIDEIMKDCKNGVVFIFDAINEMYEDGQKNYLNSLQN